MLKSIREFLFGGPAVQRRIWTELYSSDDITPSESIQERTLFAESRGRRGKGGNILSRLDTNMLEPGRVPSGCGFEVQRLRVLAWQRFENGKLSAIDPSRIRLSWQFLNTVVDIPTPGSDGEVEYPEKPVLLPPNTTFAVTTTVPPDLLIYEGIRVEVRLLGSLTFGGFDKPGLWRRIRGWWRHRQMMRQIAKGTFGNGIGGEVRLPTGMGG